MPDRRPKPERTTPHPDKFCKTCGRAFSWRKKWEKDWDVVKYCSDACRGHQPTETDAALEAAILSCSPSADATRRSARRKRRRWSAAWKPGRPGTR